MVQTQANTEMLFRRWQQHKISKSLILEELRNQGLSAEEIQPVWENYARYRLAKRNTLGWTLMTVGGLMGLASCIFTMIDSMPDLRNFLMYGLTTFAVSVALYGCYLVMEKPNDEED